MRWSNPWQSGILGQLHPSEAKSITSAILARLRHDSLLSREIGASYIKRNWPPALKDSGAWPLASLSKQLCDNRSALRWKSSVASARMCDAGGKAAVVSIAKQRSYQCQTQNALRKKLEEVRCQIDSWRKTRISRQNVPEPFWKAAVELARIGGSTQLRLFWD